MTPLNVVVVGDDVLARAGLVALLDSADADLRLEQADASFWNDDDGDTLDGVDAIVCDLGWDGAALPDLRDLGAPVVALVAGPDGAAAAWSAGASAIVDRGESAGPGFVETLLAAVRAAVAGLVAIQPDFVAALLPTPSADLNPPAEPLTAREIDVLQRLVEGDTNKAIARALGISDNTVKFHVNAVLTKLGAQSRTEAVVRALRLGLLPL